MKYIIQAEIDPDSGSALEAQPQRIQEVVEKWQALKPIGQYFGLTRRSMTVILEADNEDAFFEALHATWVATGDYPDVLPVADAAEFPQLLRRIGVVS